MYVDDDVMSLEVDPGLNAFNSCGGQSYGAKAQDTLLI